MENFRESWKSWINEINHPFSLVTYNIWVMGQSHCEVMHVTDLR